MKPYGELSLTIASPVQTLSEVFTVEHVRDWLRLPTWSEEETHIEGLISASREVAEILQGRDLIVKQYDLTLDDLCSPQIELRAPLRSVDAFELTDSDGDVTTLTENTDYIVDTRRALVMPPYGESWPSFTPWPSSAVLIRFTSGMLSTDPFWSDAGARVKQGMRMLITGWYEERIPFSKQSVTELPYGITALLSFGSRKTPR